MRCDPGMRWALGSPGSAICSADCWSTHACGSSDVGGSRLFFDHHVASRWAGKTTDGGHHVALGLNVLAFVPMIGLGIGVGVLVGQHVASKRIDLARRTVWNALTMSILYTSGFAVALGLFPSQMAACMRSVRHRNATRRWNRFGTTATDHCDLLRTGMEYRLFL